MQLFLDLFEIVRKGEITALAKLAAPWCLSFNAHTSSIFGSGFCESEGLYTCNGN